MFRLPTLRLGRVLGIPVELNASWFLVFAIVGWTWSFDVYPTLLPGRPVWVDVASGLATTLLFFASIVAHEMSHSLVARRAGIPVLRVTLFMFGGVAQLSEEPRSARVEAIMSLAGPAMSLALAATLLGAYRGLAATGVSESWSAPLLMLAGVNLSVAMFNLVPGYPMDGGRVLHAFLWWATGDRRLATRLASWVGQGLGFALAGVGAWLLATGSLEGAWFVLLGFFLRSLAASAYRSQVARLEVSMTPARDVMEGPVPTVPGALPLPDTLQQLGRRAQPIAVVVGESGESAGVISVRRAWDVLASAPGVPTAAQAAEPLETAWLVDARESLETAARRFEGSAAEILFVVDGGRVVGTLSRAAVDVRLVRLASQRPTGLLRWLAPRS